MIPLYRTHVYLYTGHTPESPYILSENGFPKISNASPLMQDVIRKAMAFWRKDRIKSIAEFLYLLNGGDAITGIDITQPASNIVEGENSCQTHIPLDNIKVGINASLIKGAKHISQDRSKEVIVTNPQKNNNNISTIFAPKVVAGLVAGMVVLAIVIIVLFLNRTNNQALDEECSVTVANIVNGNDSDNDAADMKGGEDKKDMMPFKTFTETVNGVDFKMIAVDGGRFEMGATSNQIEEADDDEFPLHNVTLSDYYIGEVEVTQELWEAVMGNNPSYYKKTNNPVEQVSWVIG